MTCPRPGSTWVAEPRAQKPALFLQHHLVSALFPFPSPSPSSVVLGLPSLSQKMDKKRRQSQESRGTEYLGAAGHRTARLCCTAGPMGHCWAPSGARNTRGQTKCQDLAAPLERVLHLCSPSLLPLFHCLLTHLFGDLLAFVYSSTRLTHST